MGGAGLTLPPGAKEAAPVMKFTLPTNRTFVRYGDCVSLFDQVGSHGFLNADGVIDDSLRIIVNSDGSVPDKFRDCVFTIMPSQQYAAQKAAAKRNDVPLADRDFGGLPLLSKGMRQGRGVARRESIESASSTSTYSGIRNNRLGWKLRM